MKQVAKLLLINILMIISVITNAQEIVELWPDGVPNSKKSKVEELIVWEGSRRISQVINPTIEVFLPSKEQSLRMGVLICPGGGYGRLAYDKEGTDIAKFLNGQGIAAFVLKYRLPDEETNVDPKLSPLMDAKRAMEVIRENAAEWNLDSTRVGVMGFSAGGHLASTLGTHFEEVNRPDFMILMYPVVTMKLDFTHRGSRENLIGAKPSEDLISYYSNELQVKKDTPPTFIIHSMDDGAVPVENSFQLASAMKQQKVPVEMHIYPQGGHGYGLALNQDRLNQWPMHLINWLRDL